VSIVDLEKIHRLRNWRQRYVNCEKLLQASKSKSKQCFRYRLTAYVL
jgi:hypothetical protein